MIGYGIVGEYVIKKFKLEKEDHTSKVFVMCSNVAFGLVFLIFWSLLVSLVTADTLYPTDDSFVTLVTTGENGGSSNQLIVTHYYFPYEYRSYLKFNVTCNGTATFNMWQILSINPANISLLLVENNTWNENTINWNNQPCSNSSVNYRIVNAVLPNNTLLCSPTPPSYWCVCFNETCVPYNGFSYNTTLGSCKFLDTKEINARWYTQPTNKYVFDVGNVSEGNLSLMLWANYTTAIHYFPSKEHDDYLEGYYYHDLRPYLNVSCEINPNNNIQNNVSNNTTSNSVCNTTHITNVTNITNVTIVNNITNYVFYNNTYEDRLNAIENRVSLLEKITNMLKEIICKHLRSYCKKYGMV